MHIESERLVVTGLTPEMAEAVHLNSLDEDVRRFVPDEVFETPEIARQAVDDLINCYDTDEGPFVYAVLLKQTSENIGYVQLVAVPEGWEIGYHIAKRYTGHGYATEALRAFLPVISNIRSAKTIEGICLADNAASARVLEKCGFVLRFRANGPYQGEEREIVHAQWTAPE